MKSENNWESLLAILTPIAVIVLACLFLKEFLEAPFGPWNAARLSPTIAIRLGYDLYYPATQGPVLDTLYGPVVAWCYLPATLAHSPTEALLIAEGISMLLFFLPIVWLLKEEPAGEHLSHQPALWAFLCFGYLTFRSIGLHYSAFLIHADAPALGLGALSLMFLKRAMRTSSSWNLFLSALLAVLSAWAKQTMAPLCVVLPLYLWISRRPRQAIRMIGALAAGFMLVTAYIWHHFNPQALIFNVLTVPRMHRWRIPSNNTLAVSRLGALVWGFKELLNESFWILLLFGWLNFWNRRTSSPAKGSWRKWIATSPGGLLFLVSLFLAPGAILGRIKEGGDLNNLSLCVYFLLAAMAVELRAALSRRTTDEKSETTAPVGVFTLLLLGLCTIYYLPTLTRLPPFMQRLAHNPQQIAYDYLKAHPGEVYFPNDPLPALMANGTLYHFCEGIHDRERAGFPLSDEHFQSGIPPHLKWIALSPGTPGIKYLPAYQTPIAFQDLPGWVVLEKS